MRPWLLPIICYIIISFPLSFMLDSSMWMSSAFSYCWLVPIYVSSTRVLRMFDTLIPIFKSRVLGIAQRCGNTEWEKNEVILESSLTKPTNSYAFGWMVLKGCSLPPPLPQIEEMVICPPPITWFAEPTLVVVFWACDLIYFWIVQKDLKSLFGICSWSCIEPHTTQIKK